jgi:hypothetical protein
LSDLLADPGVKGGKSAVPRIAELGSLGSVTVVHMIC